MKASLIISEVKYNYNNDTQMVIYLMANESKILSY